MRALIEVPMESGKPLPVEVEAEDNEGLLSSFSPGNIIAHASQGLESALEPIRGMVATLCSQLAQPFNSADEVETEFGLKFSTKVGLFVAQGDAEAAIKVKLKWNQSEKRTASDASTSAA